MLNFLKNNNSDDQKPPEPAADKSESIPDDLTPTPVEVEPLSSSIKLPPSDETRNAAHDSFPALAIPRDTPSLPHEPEFEPDPYSTGKSKSFQGPLYPPLPQKTTRRNVLEYIFSFETRSGRFIRSLLRWLAAITGLFALGLLAGYLMLYQPTQNELEAAQLKLKQANQAVSQKDQSMQSALTDRTQAQQSLQQAQDELKKASSENDLLMVLVNVSNARVALVNKQGPTAKAAIEQAQADLAKAQPFLENLDKSKFDVLKTRLDLAYKELGGDPQAAQTDLEKLGVDLTDLRQKLFTK